MPDPPSTLTHDSYKIGWICALSAELTAAMAVLDEEHPPLPQPPTDSNSYTLGRIGAHNVVIAGLPSGQMGTTPAATVATNLQRTFEQVKVGLMVGIGGGVPSPHDIRLGDVVISKPNANASNGGIVQYDFGKHIKDNEYIRTGSLNTPPRPLLTALTTMQAKHQMLELPDHLNSIMVRKLPGEFSYQGEENDILFEAAYEHGQGDTCANCDRSRLVSRSSRRHRGIVIHYGTVASGNSVIKSGVTRDLLAKSHEVLCFEMEAAGINAFPYLIVRGICDYCDSHKNKRWQKHAALNAAICAKELLSFVASDGKRLETSQYQSYAQTLSKTFMVDEVVAKDNVTDEQIMKSAVDSETRDYTALPPSPPSELSIQEALRVLERHIIAPEEPRNYPRRIFAERKVVDSIKAWHNAPDSRILRLAGTTENMYPSRTSLISASVWKSIVTNPGPLVYVQCSAPKNCPEVNLVNVIYSLIHILIRHCSTNAISVQMCQELDGTMDSMGPSFSILSDILTAVPRMSVIIDGIDRIQGTAQATHHVDSLMTLFQNTIDGKASSLKALFTTAGPCRSFQKLCKDNLIVVDVDMKKIGEKQVHGTSELSGIFSPEHH